MNHTMNAFNKVNNDLLITHNLTHIPGVKLIFTRKVMFIKNIEDL